MLRVTKRTDRLDRSPDPARPGRLLLVLSVGQGAPPLTQLFILKPTLCVTSLFLCLPFTVPLIQRPISIDSWAGLAVHSSEPENHPEEHWL